MSEPVVFEPLTDRDRQELLRISRATLREHLTTGARIVGGELRGCMGRVEADQPLYLVIEELTVAASTRDSRFEPVRVEEMKDTRLSVSVLSRVQPARAEEIEIGKHGLVITRGPRRGLLLPQVAVEHAFTVEQFLDETCKKAGLPSGAWKEPGTTLESFTADVFKERD